MCFNIKTASMYKTHVKLNYQVVDVFHSSFFISIFIITDYSLKKNNVITIFCFVRLYSTQLLCVRCKLFSSNPYLL